MIRSIFILTLVAALSFAARSFLLDEGTLTGSGAALAFGFLLLAAFQTGHIFHALKLPHLTGFILCGAIFGPEVLGLLTKPMINDLSLINKVAVGLIALTAGCELNYKKLRPLFRSIKWISICGLGAAFLGLFAFFFAISTKLPFMDGMTTGQRVIVSLICANVLTALSPSVVMGLLTETKSEGPLSQLALSIVVVGDLVIAVTFAFSDSLAHMVFPAAAGEGSIFGTLFLHIFGSIVAGVGVGAIFHLYIQRIGQRVGLFVFAICFVVAEAGGILHLDPLLTCLSAGLFLENVSPIGGHKVIHETEPAAMPVFAVFFAVIGAQVHVHAFLAFAPFAIGAAVVRAACLWAGATVGTRIAKVEPALAKRIPFGMFPQAGIAIGLANLVATNFDPWGQAASTLILGTVVVNEMVGPVLFRAALVRAGEVGKREETVVSPEDTPLIEVLVPGGAFSDEPPMA